MHIDKLAADKFVAGITAGEYLAGPGVQPLAQEPMARSGGRATSYWVLTGASDKNPTYGCVNMGIAVSVLR